MTIQISFKKNDWVFHTGPWFRPFVSWQTNPNVCTFRFGIFSIMEHLPFLPGYKQILRQLLVLRTLAIWIWYPWLLLPSFVMLMILFWKKLHKIQNHLLQHRLRIQLDLCIFCVFPPIQHFSNDRCLSVRQNELLRPSSLLPRSPLIYFWLLSGPTLESFPIFPIPCPLLPLLLCCGNFHGLEHGNKFLYRTVMLQWIVPFSCNMVLMMIR